MKEYIRNLIMRNIGGYNDNLARAEMQFRDRTPEQMAEEYGQSGDTCQSIVDDYREGQEKAKDALIWFDKLASLD